MKSLIIEILEAPIVGRPLRKLLWILTILTNKINTLTLKVFRHQPYVKKITRLELAQKEAKEQAAQDRALVCYYNTLRESLSRLPEHPRISILIPVYKPEIRFLRECLGSLAAQIYSNWEACIVDDASGDPQIDRLIEEFSQRFPNQVRYAKNPKNRHISVTTNHAFALATGEFISLLDHDDRLLPNALAEVVRHININPTTDIFYSDECIIDQEGKILGTYFKPGWSPLMHLSVNYTTHLSTYRRDLIQQIGGWREGFEGAQDHDLMLRAVEASRNPVIHIPINLYQWRSHELSTASGSEAKPYAAQAGMQAVREACQRRGYAADVVFEPRFHHYKVRFAIPDPKPLISIIIPTKDSFSLIDACLNSIFTKTTYRNFEVIAVDHSSTDGECLRLFADFSQRYPQQFKHVIYRGLFNFAALCQTGVAQSRGDFVLLLNNDTEVYSPEWLEELLSVAQLAEVGAVGGKLLYPNGRIQHAGIHGLGQMVAGHTGIHLKGDCSDYFGYLQTTHEVLAITGACLLVSRKKYDEVGGLDAVFVPNGFGDVDFCLKLRKHGYNNVYVPYAVLEHKESVTRLAAMEVFERSHMYQQWGSQLVCDTYRHISFQPFIPFAPEKQFSRQEPSEELFHKLMQQEQKTNGE